MQTLKTVTLTQAEWDIIMLGLADNERALLADAEKEPNPVDAEDMRMAAEDNVDILGKIRAQL